MSKTITFYDDNAQNFFSETKDLDMSEFYSRFLRHLPSPDQKPGHLLDLGCGSGRDANYFHKKGFQVTAIDASKELIKLASTWSPIEINYQVMKFEEMNFEGEFDGIWACASLLHCKQTELEAVLVKIHKALKPDGVFYCSFKQGSGEREKNDRMFLDIETEDLANLLTSLNFKILDSWTTHDVREGREDELWTNCISKK